MPIIVGDIHSKWDEYLSLIEDLEDTVQLGDFNLGLPGKEASVVEAAMKAGNHRMIRGNHDSPAACRAFSQWIPDGTIEGDTMYLGGAMTIEIDRVRRVRDFDWWEDEELDYQTLGDMINRYEAAKPDVMITHDAPDVVARQMFPFYIGGNESRTRQALQTMLEIHRPSAWAYGHWHPQGVKQLNVLGCEFLCVGELEITKI
jgi:predicted phosphohydrolase